MKYYTLDELCTDIVDCPHSTPIWRNDGIRVIRNFNLNKGKIDFTNGYYVDEETYLSRTKRATPEPNDIVISREAPVGAVGIVPFNLKCCLGQRLVLLKVNKQKCEPQYLVNALLSDFVQQQFKRADTTGSIVSNLCIPDLKEIIIPVVENNQKNIANLLLLIQEKLSTNDKICSELEAMAKTLYDYWFTQFDFPDENGRPYRSSGGEMVWNEKLKREIPKGWSVGTIRDYGTIVSGGTPSTICAGFYCDNGIAWITPNDLAGNQDKMFVEHGERDITKKGLENSSAVLMPRRSILLSTRAPIGYLAIADNEISTNQGFKSIIPDAGYSEYYIYYFLKSNVKAIEQQGAGTTFKEVSKDTLSAFPAYLPPMTLVNDFAERISGYCNLRCTLEKENRELTALRDWLLPLLMNGQATVAEAE